MVDYLGDLQLAGDNNGVYRVTLDAYEGEEDDKDVLRVRHSPPDRPFSSLEETEGETCSISETTRASSHSPPPPPMASTDDSHLLYTSVPDPIKLRGVGGTTMFGMNNHFEDDFPAHLVGKVAPEEFHGTIDYINGILHKSIPLNLKCLVFGCLCCPCTLGISMGPVLYLNKRTQTRIEKFMAQENYRLYNKLGLNLRLHKEQCEGTNLTQYVILVEFLPKVPLYRPE